MPVGRMLCTAILSMTINVSCSACAAADSGSAAIADTSQTADTSQPADTGCSQTQFDDCDDASGTRADTEELADVRHAQSSICPLLEPLLVSEPAVLEAIWSECCADDPLPSVDWESESVVCYQDRMGQCPVSEGVSGIYDHNDPESGVVVAISHVESCSGDCLDTGSAPVTILWRVPATEMTTCRRGTIAVFDR